VNSTLAHFRDAARRNENSQPARADWLLKIRCADFFRAQFIAA